MLERRTLLAGGPGAIVGESYTVPATPRASLDIDAGWKFIRSDVTGAQASNFNDTSWSSVDLPHTWNAFDGQDGGTNGRANFYNGVGWYRKSITVPSSMIGDTIKVRFDGASIATTLYVNGQQVGSHRGAFGAFDFDITNQLTGGGTHVLAVKVDNTAGLQYEVAPQSGDFNMAGGLYRGVSLIGVEKQHVSVDDFASSGVYFSASNVSSTSANVSIRTGLSNDASSPRDLSIRTYLVDQAGEIVAEAITPRTLAAGEDATITQSATVTNPHLWNGRIDPYLHNLYVEVRDASTDALLDLVKERVGIRSYQITPNGFVLNGSPYDVRGASLHQDRFNKGWAISDEDIREDVDFFLEMGATALRTAHYQMSELIYDLADEKGLIVYTEIPNVGSNSAGSIPMSPVFLANAEQQLKELIRQRYNHASIVVWGVYNEVLSNAENQAFVQKLNALAKAEDPTRLTAGASNNYNLTALERSTDVTAYNRYYGWYYGAISEFALQLDNLRAQTPAMPIGVSEYGAGGSLSQHEENPKMPQHDGPWHAEEYQSLFHEQTWKILDARPWLWGKFIWNMFDFAADYRDEGDTAGRNDKGLISYDRKTKKDAFFFYKANWSSEPVLHINSRRWTNRTEAATKIKVYSNLANPTLKLNGTTVGLTNMGDNVWISPTVNLAQGDNAVSVVGTRDGVTYTDTVTWKLSGPTTDPIKRINFQPATGTTPANYFADTGLVFGTRNGAQYGWNADNSTTTRRRNVNSDTRLDTFIHMQLGGRFVWEYALPNGDYDLTFSAGDPSYTDSINDFTVESTTVSDPDGQDNFDPFTMRVTITDGRLTIAPASTAVNAKLNYIEIAPVADDFTSVDIGSPTPAGTTVTLTPGTDYDITAGGTDIWGTSDSFRFVYRNITGDFDYSARVIDVSQGDTGSMGGLMARESTAAGARHMFMRARAQGLRASYRLTTGGESVGVGSVPFTYPNAYVRLQRAGNVFTSYGSTDGVSWTVVSQQTLVMPSTILFGMAASARTMTGATTTAKIRELTSRTAVNAPSAPTRLTATANAAMPSVTLNWSDNATNESNFRIERRLAGSATWSSVGPAAANATSFTDTSVEVGKQYLYRVFAINSAGSSGASNEVTVVVSAGVPNAPSGLVASIVAERVQLNWSDQSANETGFQIERRINNSTNSGTWTSLATVGANVTTYADTKTTPGVNYAYRVRALGGMGESGYSNTVSITAPTALSFTSTDIGITGGSTAAVGANGYDVSAGGADVWGASDQFRFLHRQVSGNFDMKVRVAGISPADVQSMGGLMARASLAADARNVFVKTRPDGKNRVTYRGTTGGQSTGVGGGTSTFPAAWLRLVRSGNTFTGYASTNGTHWTVISTVTLALPTTLSVGMAASCHAPGSQTTAQFRDVSMM